MERRYLLVLSIILIFSCSAKQELEPEVELSDKKGDLLWYADPLKPKDDNFYNLNTEPNEDGFLAVVEDFTFGKVWKVTKPAGSKRTELARTQPREPRTDGKNTFIPEEGDKVYMGWRWKGDIKGDNFPPGGFAVFQNKSQGNGTQNYPMNIDWDGKEMVVNAYTAGNGTESQASRRKELWKKAVAENEWITIVMGITYSRDAKIGTFEFWFNGEKQSLAGQNNSEEKKLFHRTLDDNGNYSKWGAYNETSRPYEISVFLDEMRVAKDYDTANPLNY